MLRNLVSFSTDMERRLIMDGLISLSPWPSLVTSPYMFNTIISCSLSFLSLQSEAGFSQKYTETKIRMQVVWEVVPRSTGRGVGN